MRVVGLTGGIGSGKTAVADHFQRLGITVVDADLASRQVVEPGQPALAAIAEHFGQAILQADGTLDRAALRERIFQDPAERHWLETLLHPRIGEVLLAGLAAATSPYAILVSPLLFEAGQATLVDRVLLVDAPEALQLERTMARDQNSAEQVQAIIKAQASRAERQARADDILVNDGSLEDLLKKVDALHERYLKLAAKEAPAP